MQTWHLIDKTTWPLGPWVQEPDAAEWIHCGLNCMIVRNFMTGGLCGYVGVDENHICFNVDFSDIEINWTHTLTFSGLKKTFKGQKEKNKPLWWLGAFFGEFLPGLFCNLPIKFIEELNISTTYKNFDYVKLEVEKLARALSSGPLLLEKKQ